jgi:hypothetical protein
MVTSVQLEADLVADDTDSAAFVYGALRFALELCLLLLFLLERCFAGNSVALS